MQHHRTSLWNLFVFVTLTTTFLITAISGPSHAFTTTTLNMPRAVMSRSLIGIVPKRHLAPISGVGKDGYCVSLQQALDQETQESASAIKKDSLIESSAITLRRLTWVSWWSQVILTVVSSITLLFAKSVLRAGPETSAVAGGFVFAGSGIALSFLSIIWTWGGTRLSKRLRRAMYSRIKVANMIRRTITIGSSLNLFGMLITLIGALQIVGLLASKLLTMQGVTPLVGLSAASVSAQTLQPLDILIVQANTNTLLSHFISLVCCLVMTRSIDRLDPPSMEDDPRG